VPDDAYVAAAVAIAAAITFTLRAVPFAIIDRVRSWPIVGYLAAALPAGVMVILVVYLEHNAADHGHRAAVASLIGIGAAAALHVWKSNALLSIVGATSAYIVALHCL
jgi:branched-subunit amino acid transport protein AzlD